jgi:hypothetical protein
MTTAISDPSTNPPYYNDDDVMQVIERYNLGFCLGNVVKYILRSANKNGTVDLRKALWYLQREISNPRTWELFIGSISKSAS